jgi:hypothetical protein
MGKKKKGKCVFCGDRTAMTIEDVVPQWAARELRRLHPHEYVKAVTAHTDGNLVLGVRMTKVGSAAAVKLPLVCGPCNNLLGREIEDPTSKVLKPMLGGTPSTVTPEDCAQIAAWGTLKALCYDIIQPDPGRVVFTPELHTFRADRRASPQFKMWMGRYDGHDSDLAWHMRAATINSADYRGVPAGTPHSQVLTRILGDLIMQSVYVGIRGRALPSRFERPEGDPFAIRVWPRPSQPLEWPPLQSITGENLRYFAGIPESLVSMPTPPEPDMPLGEGQRPHGLLPEEQTPRQGP